jgi:acyl-CoA ligase (AMP-forming) (exosortase A-associated)
MRTYTGKPVFTIPDILKTSAIKFPEREAVIENTRSISYKDLEARSSALAHYLCKRGVKKGDRVGILLEKSIEEVISIWGIAKAGGIFVPITPSLTPSQVAYRRDDCGMRCIISIAQKVAALEKDTRCIAVDIKEFDSIFKGCPDEPVAGAVIGKNDLAAILYTSGSTGYPKGVVLNHDNLVLGTQVLAEYLGNTEDDVIISVLPFSFDYGLNQLLTTCLAGGTLVLQRSMLPNDICNTLRDKRVTGFAGIPTVWVMLLQNLSSFKKLSFPDLRYITNSGGAIPGAYLKELRRVLKGTQIYLMYGLTEAFRSTYLPPEELEGRPDSIGKPIPGVRIMVINKEGKECLPGEEGVLLHCGGVIFQGYWNNPEETKKVLKPVPQGTEMAVWSGDTVKKDKEGFLYFIGRDDEMIKCLGHRISPQEIEDALYKNAEVKEAVVFGVRDDLRGHKIKAVISLNKKRAQVSEKAILDACRGYLPEFMIPREIAFVEDLPKTATGKIDRLKVREAYSQHAGKEGIRR